MYGNKIIIQVKTITGKNNAAESDDTFSFVCLWHGMRHDILNTTTTNNNKTRFIFQNASLK